MATGIGEALVAARRQQGVSLADAAAETRVRESYLAALEEEDFAALGGDVYVKGFLRSYARFLRLDPEPLLATYRANFERAPEEMTSPLAHQPVGPMPSEGRPGIVIGAGVAVLVLILLAVIGLVSGRDDPEEDLAGAPEPVASEVTPAPLDPSEPAADATDEPTESQTDAPSDGPTEILTSDGVELVLDIEGGPSWLEVTVDGEQQTAQEHPDGTSLTFEADETIAVIIGDAGVVNVTVNGDDRGMLGERSEVVEKTYTTEEAA